MYSNVNIYIISFYLYIYLPHSTTKTGPQKKSELKSFDPQQFKEHRSRPKTFHRGTQGRLRRWRTVIREPRKDSTVRPEEFCCSLSSLSSLKFIVFVVIYFFACQRCFQQRGQWWCSLFVLFSLVSFSGGDRRGCGVVPHSCLKTSKSTEELQKAQVKRSESQRSDLS